MTEILKFPQNRKNKVSRNKAVPNSQKSKCRENVMSYGIVKQQSVLMVGSCLPVTLVSVVLICERYGVSLTNTLGARGFSRPAS